MVGKLSFVAYSHPASAFKDLYIDITAYNLDHLAHEARPSYCYVADFILRNRTVYL